VARGKLRDLHGRTRVRRIKYDSGKTGKFLGAERLPHQIAVLRFDPAREAGGVGGGPQGRERGGIALAGNDADPRGERERKCTAPGVKVRDASAG
jgi:hypothetical protein